VSEWANEEERVPFILFPLSSFLSFPLGGRYFVMGSSLGSRERQTTTSIDLMMGLWWSARLTIQSSSSFLAWRGVAWLGRRLDSREVNQEREEELEKRGRFLRCQFS